VAVIPPQAGITVSGSPVTGSGAITLGLSGNLAAVEGLSGTGGVERTAANTWGTYTLSAAGKALLDDADIAAQRTTLGLGVLATAAAVSGGNAGTITDGTITNDDISTTAAIDQSKISGLTPALAGKESSVTAGTTAQFYRGDKSWQDFNTAARGAVSITAPLTYNSSTGVFGLGQASAVANGYLSSFDFTLFYNKQAAITSTSNVNAGTLTTAQQNAVEINPFSTAAGNTGELRFEELAANGTNYVGFKAPDLLTANRIWTLPSADGLSGQVLSTDGNGRLSWVPMGSGFTWQSKSADFTAAPNTGYLVSGSNRTIVTLISTCNVGDTIRIIGTGTVGWRLTATGGSIYEIGGTASTVFESQFPSQAADLICSGTAAWRLTALSSNTSSSPLLMGRNPFITPGSHTWTRPTDVTRVRVTVIGGGGGGGGATNYGSAGGGGSGSVCVRDIDVSSLSTATINVGSGAPGGRVRRWPLGMADRFHL